MNFSDYQLEIINKAMSVFLCNYDNYDLEDLMYSETELEAEIILIQEKLETELTNLYKQEGMV